MEVPDATLNISLSVGGKVSRWALSSSVSNASAVWAWHRSVCIRRLTLLLQVHAIVVGFAPVEVRPQKPL